MKAKRMHSKSIGRHLSLSKLHELFMMPLKASLAGGVIALIGLSSSVAKANPVFEVNDWKEPPKNIPWSTVVEIKSPFETYKAVWDQDYRGRSCFISCNYYDGLISKWTAEQVSVARFSAYCTSLTGCRKNYYEIPYGVELSVDSVIYKLSGSDGLFSLSAKARKAIENLSSSGKISIRIGGNNQVIYNIGEKSSRSIATLIKESVQEDRTAKVKGVTVTGSPAIALGSMVQPVIKRTLPGVAQVETPTSKGTGFVIDKSGLMLTNRHVIGRFTEATIKFNDGRERTAKVIGRTADLDIALLQIEGSTVKNQEPALPLCVRKPATVGEDVIVIGNPLGLQATTTRGIVSGIRDEDGASMIQIDAPVNPGNSGGPVVNYNGEVIGIVTSKYVAVGIEGIGFAIGLGSALESLGVSYIDDSANPASKDKQKIKLTSCLNKISG